LALFLGYSVSFLVAPASLPVAPAKAGAQKNVCKNNNFVVFLAQLWVPAFAGTTEEGAGTTEKGAGTTRKETLCLFPCMGCRKHPARAAGPDAQLRWFFEQVCGGAGNVEQFRQRFE